jgi:hypothetical protein
MANKRSRPGGSTTEDSLRARLQGHIRAIGLVGLDDGRLDELPSWAMRDKPSYMALLERALGQVAGLKRERRIERRIKLSGLTVRSRTINRWIGSVGARVPRAASTVRSGTTRSTPSWFSTASGASVRRQSASMPAAEPR